MYFTYSGIEKFLQLSKNKKIVENCHEGLILFKKLCNDTLDKMKYKHDASMKNKSQENSSATSDILEEENRTTEAIEMHKEKHQRKHAATSQKMACSKMISFAEIVHGRDASVQVTDDHLLFAVDLAMVGTGHSRDYAAQV